MVRAAGMWTKTSHSESLRPASRTRTERPGSALSRLARALPAEPPPTTTKSYRCSPMCRSSVHEAVGCPQAPVGVIRCTLGALLCMGQHPRGPFLDERTTPGRPTVSRSGVALQATAPPVELPREGDADLLL